MAQKRMFNKSITNSSRFLMMSLSAQALYFHLGMNADDDGFCEHFTVMRMTESKPDDLKILQAKGFIHVFDDRILIIRDWKENNNIRHDRYTPSKYLEEYKKEILALSECHTVGIPDDNQRYTQIRLDKISIDTDKDNISDVPKETSVKKTRKKKTSILLTDEQEDIKNKLRSHFEKLYLDIYKKSITWDAKENTAIIGLVKKFTPKDINERIKNLKRKSISNPEYWTLLPTVLLYRCNQLVDEPSQYQE